MLNGKKKMHELLEWIKYDLSLDELFTLKMLTEKAIYKYKEKE